MGLDEIKSKLIKRSMELWEKQLHENAVIKEGKMRTYYRFKTIFKKEIYLNVIGNREGKVLHNLESVHMIYQ